MSVAIRRRSVRSGGFVRTGVMVLLGVGFALNMHAQSTASELRKVLDRLAELERANRDLAAEVRVLSERLQAENGVSPAQSATAQEPLPLEEQVAVQKQEIEEQAQTKVEASQHFPIRLKGMILFNTFLNSKQGGQSQYPSLAGPRGDASGGAGLRQSIIGLEYQGPEIFGAGKVHASLEMDFFGGSGQPLDQSLRIRTGIVQVDWRNRSLSFGLNKPLFAPRNPTSLAQVGVSPLTGAGNLWMWIPQVRLEQRFQFSETTRLTAQVALVQTRELPSYDTGTYFAEVEPARPGLEGRVAFAHSLWHGGSLEFAPGFHMSTSHVAHAPVPSHLVSADWLINPGRFFEITGAFYTGENVAHLGNGGTGQGFEVAGAQHASPMRSRGGWSQITVPAGERMSFHFFSGLQSDHDQLQRGQIQRNLAYGANVFYNLASNIILSFETSQVRTRYVAGGTQLNNHYDLALAYLF
jgi:hypothetical protein